MASSLLFQILVDIGAALGPSIQLPGSLARAKLVIGLLYITGKTQAPCLALGSVIISLITLIIQSWNISLSKLSDHTVRLRRSLFRISIFLYLPVIGF